MVAVKNIPIVGKFIIVIAGFGVVSVCSACYSTSEMRQIGGSYSGAIEHQAFAALELTRANNALSAERAAIADAEIANTDEGNRLAEQALKQGRQQFATSMQTAKALDPSKAVVIEAIVDRETALVDKTCAKAIQMGLAGTDPASVAAAQLEYLNVCSPAFPSLISDMKALVQASRDTMAKTDEGLAAATDRTVMMTFAAALGGLVLVTLFAYFSISAWVSRPVKGLAETMRRLAGGDLAVAVAGVERKDEIGPMAQAVQVFKDSGLKLQASEAEAARQRAVADKERAANEAARAEIQRQQQAVVASIAAGLERLSKGDLTSRLSQAFAEEYEKLRADFNATADSLRDAMSTIVAATDGISTGSDQIAHASDDLSRRTEQQAASLEETSAALNVITETVKAMATNASDAAKVVLTTRSAAETSGQIVQQAVDAMSKIKDSSNQISNIIGVIDEIAFQTNLLALNAGVEAARAGDAGRGFAVVASEVRGLAQRSAEAAKEIKALISASSVQVETGVVLVDRTGAALKDIVVKVAEMDTLVRQISASSQEQATGLAEINTAISQMDQVVQQNAAMVEESTAAAHALKSETLDLTTMVGRFELGDGQGRGARGNPVHAAQARLARQVRTPAKPSAARPALKPVAQTVEKDWTEF